MIVDDPTGEPVKQSLAQRLLSIAMPLIRPELEIMAEDPELGRFVDELRAHAEDPE